MWLVCLAGSVAAALGWARLFYVSHTLAASDWVLIAAASLCAAASLAFGYASRR